MSRKRFPIDAVYAKISLMKNIVQNSIAGLKRFIKNKKLSIPTAIILIIILYFAFSGSNNNSVKAVTIKPSDFTQEVRLTGKVVAQNKVSMGFESSGRVSAVNVKVGDVVKKGTVLASISNGDLYASVQQKQALVDAENAKLSEVSNGSRPEDISIAESDVASAQVSAEQSLGSMVDQIKDSYSKFDDVMRNKIDQLYINPDSNYPGVKNFDVPLDNANLQNKLQMERFTAGQTDKKWGESTMALTSKNLTDDNITEAKTNLAFMRDWLNDVAIVVVSLSNNPSVTSAQISQYKTDISSARLTILTAISSLNAAEQTYRTAIVALKKSQDQLALKKVGGTADQISTQQAQVKSAEASLANAYALLNKTLITAPFDGTITKVDVDAGEIASPNTPVIDMIGGGQYKIESYVSESDIAKMSIGQSADVTLDAYGKDQKFSAKIVSVESSETIIDGVSTYKTTFVFDSEDPRIKSGMTSNITVTTDQKKGVVVVPQEAVYLLNGDKVIDVLVDGKIVTKKVVTGGISTDGDLLIISGVNEGDTVQIKTTAQ